MGSVGLWALCGHFACSFTSQDPRGQQGCPRLALRIDGRAAPHLRCTVNVLMVTPLPLSLGVSCGGPGLRSHEHDQEETGKRLWSSREVFSPPPPFSLSLSPSPTSLNRYSCPRKLANFGEPLDTGGTWFPVTVDCPGPRRTWWQAVSRGMPPARGDLADLSVGLVHSGVYVTRPFLTTLKLTL